MTSVVVYTFVSISAFQVGLCVVSIG